MAVPGSGIKPIPAISPEDVGEITAQTIVRNDLGGKRFRLTGHEAISFPDAAKKISVIAEKQIKHIKIPLVVVKAASIIIGPFNPLIRFIHYALKALNNFPSDLAKKVPEDHKKLRELFEYEPVTLEMEINRRVKENKL